MKPAPLQGGIEMKGKYVALAVFVLTAFMASELCGAAWKFIGFNRYRDAFYLDEETVKQLSGGTIQLWAKLTVAEKSLFRRAMKKDLERVPKKIEEVKYLKMKEELDCQAQKIRHLELIYYDYHDRVLLRTVNPKAKWIPVVPGSLWYELLSTSCGKLSGTTSD